MDIDRDTPKTFIGAKVRNADGREFTTQNARGEDQGSGELQTEDGDWVELDCITLV